MYVLCCIETCQSRGSSICKAARHPGSSAEHFLPHNPSSTNTFLLSRSTPCTLQIQSHHLFLSFFPNSQLLSKWLVCLSLPLGLYIPLPERMEGSDRLDPSVCDYVAQCVGNLVKEKKVNIKIGNWLTSLVIHIDFNAIARTLYPHFPASSIHIQQCASPQRPCHPRWKWCPKRWVLYHTQIIMF